MKKFWPFHKHKFFEVDRQWLLRLNRFVEGPDAERHPVTLITSRCAGCKKYHQQVLVGYLPGGEVRGPLSTKEGRVPHG